MSQKELEVNLEEMVKAEEAAQKRTSLIYMISGALVFIYLIFLSTAVSKMANPAFLIDQAHNQGTKQITTINQVLVDSAPKVAKAIIDQAEIKLFQKKQEVEQHLSVMINDYVDQLDQNLSSGSSQALAQAQSPTELKAQYTHLFNQIDDKNREILKASYQKHVGSLASIKQTLKDLSEGKDLNERDQHLRDIIGASLSIMDHHGVKM